MANKKRGIPQIVIGAVCFLLPRFIGQLLADMLFESIGITGLNIALSILTYGGLALVIWGVVLLVRKPKSTANTATTANYSQAVPQDSYAAPVTTPTPAPVETASKRVPATALIQCPACGRDVAASAKACPNCGYEIALAFNDRIRIKIAKHPTIAGCQVRIFNLDTDTLLVFANAGSVAEIKSDKPIRIGFCGLTKSIQCTATVSPENGGKYAASWRVGVFSPAIGSCTPVDVIDSE